MPYTDIKHKIDLLKEQIEQHGKLMPEQLNKVNYKFRLEWNFNSNSMEGNTLTINETKSLMIGNVNVHQKSLKDVLEMKGHDTVVEEILKIGKGEVRLSEKRIKDIHKSIMHEDDPKKKRLIGEWKEEYNEIINGKGEKYTFLPPDEVIDAIHDLLNRTNAAIDAVNGNKKNVPHPLDIAFDFHLEYINIHPFYDGNGRTARILSNLILISLGYPPFWITVKERDVYYNYLADIQNHWGSPDLLKEFLAEQILHSQELILHVIEGKDIEDEDDLDKEIAIWKRGLEKKDVVKSKNNVLIAETYINSLKPLFQTYLDKATQFDELFVRKMIYNNIDSNESSSEGLKKFNEVINEIISEYTESNKTVIYSNSFYSLELSISFQGFKNNGINTFNKTSKLLIYLDEFSYTISGEINNNQSDYYIRKLYSEFLSNEEINSIVKDTVLKLFEEIKSSIK